MDAERLTEKELLSACIQGCKESWDTFVSKYTNLIHHTIRGVFHTYKVESHNQDAHDIHNNLFLSLIEDNYKKLRQYEGRNGCSVSSWLVVVTSNIVLKFIKRQNIPGNTTVNVDEIEVLDSHEKQPDEVLLEREREELFKELVSGLNTNDMLFLELYYRKELSVETVADVLSIAVSTVYSRNSRIREKLIKISKKERFIARFLSEKDLFI
jgi:RNA polymerase sigma factor (sigma-70 family)